MIETPTFLSGDIIAEKAVTNIEDRQFLLLCQLDFLISLFYFNIL